MTLSWHPQSKNFLIDCARKLVNNVLIFAIWEIHLLPERLHLTRTSDTYIYSVHTSGGQKTTWIYYIFQPFFKNAKRIVFSIQRYHISCPYIFIVGCVWVKRTFQSFDCLFCQKILRFESLIFIHSCSHAPEFWKWVFFSKTVLPFLANFP